jgi:hypothetical protein
MPLRTHFLRSEHTGESLHRQEREVQQASPRDKQYLGDARGNNSDYSFITRSNICKITRGT